MLIEIEIVYLIVLIIVNLMLIVICIEMYIGGISWKDCYFCYLLDWVFLCCEYYFGDVWGKYSVIRLVLRVFIYRFGFWVIGWSL